MTCMKAYVRVMKRVSVSTEPSIDAFIHHKIDLDSLCSICYFFAIVSMYSPSESWPTPFRNSVFKLFEQIYLFVLVVP